MKTNTDQPFVDVENRPDFRGNVIDTPRTNALEKSIPESAKLCEHFYEMQKLARVMYGDPVAFDNEGNPFAFKPVLYAKRSKLHSRTFVAIPFNTGNKKRDAQQARKLAAFWNLTEDERVEKLAPSVCYFASMSWDLNIHREKARTITRAILAAITGGRT
jgi:hypothetical protein